MDWNLFSEQEREQSMIYQPPVWNDSSLMVEKWRSQLEPGQNQEQPTCQLRSAREHSGSVARIEPGRRQPRGREAAS